MTEDAAAGQGGDGAEGEVTPEVEDIGAADDVEPDEDAPGEDFQEGDEQDTEADAPGEPGPDGEDPAEDDADEGSGTDE